jgi:hypothetical protein
MHISSAAVQAPFIAVCLLMLGGSTAAADDCSVAGVLVNSWVRMERAIRPRPLRCAAVQLQVPTSTIPFPPWSQPCRT